MMNLILQFSESGGILMAYNAIPREEDPEKLAHFLAVHSDRTLNKFFVSLEYMFGRYIFPLIDPAPFRVLYAETKRPCYPVNVLIAAEIYRLMMGLSDRQMVDAAVFNLAVRAALHLYQYDEGDHVFSRDALEEFRIRCKNYQDATGIDLMRNALMDMAEKEADLIHTDQTVSRIDTGFVDSHIEKLSRMKLLYRCIARLAISMDRIHVDIPERMQHYLSPDDWNLVSYHEKSIPDDEKLQTILEDARTLLAQSCTTEEAVLLPAWDLLKRVYEDQVFEEADGSLRLKKSKAEGLNSAALQSPADPDATFRKKAGEEHQGYVGVIVDFGSGNTAIKKYWKYAVNITSDAVFLEDYLNSLEDQPATDEPVILVGDGLFSSADAKELAAKKNIRIITTNLSGKKPDLFLLKHQYSQDGTAVKQCAAGKLPLSSSFNSTNETILAHFEKNDCEECPFRKQCRASRQKKSFALRISRPSVKRAENWQGVSEEEFRKYARYRNGIESDFSLMRRYYRIDEMPVRTFMDTSYWFNCVMGAMNAKQVCKYFQKIGQRVMRTL